MQVLKPAAFLDRDGTLNVDKNYIYKIDDFEYINGVIEGLKILRDKGYLLVIITNQSGIARGYYKETDFIVLTEWMLNDLKEKRIDISGIYYCPHHPKATILRYRKECKCRKPGTELFWKAQKELGIDMERSIAIGDKERDLSICKESSVRGFLVGNSSFLEIANRVKDYSKGEVK